MLRKPGFLLLILSTPEFPHLPKEKNKSAYLIDLLWELNVLMHTEYWDSVCQRVRKQKCLLIVLLRKGRKLHSPPLKTLGHLRCFILSSLLIFPLFSHKAEHKSDCIILLCVHVGRWPQWGLRHLVALDDFSTELLGNPPDVHSKRRQRNFPVPNRASTLEFWGVGTHTSE